MGRSSAYWSTNRYTDQSVEPAPTAPLDDLPATTAARFRMLREGLLQIDGVASRYGSWDQPGSGPGNTGWGTASSAGCTSCAAFWTSRSRCRIARRAACPRAEDRRSAGPLYRRGAANRTGQVVLAGDPGPARGRGFPQPGPQEGRVAHRTADTQARAPCYRAADRRIWKPTRIVGLVRTLGCVMKCADYTSRAFDRLWRCSGSPR